jgi:membrane protease YdiL (CAAX protease family)
MSDSSSHSPVPPVIVETERRGWRLHLFLVTGYILAVFVMAIGRTSPALTHTPRRLIVVGLVNMAIFGLILGAAFIFSRASQDDLLLRWRTGFWTVPLGIGYSIALRIFIVFVAVGIFLFVAASHLATPREIQNFLSVNRPNLERLVDISALRNNPLYYWLTLTFVSFVLAGLREELWRSAFIAGLRGAWPRVFGSRRGEINAVVLAALLFGIAHLSSQGIVGASNATLLGLGLGLIMIFHRSVWPAVIAHGAFDATSMALLPWVWQKLHQQALGLT